jgi:hypothetical protein
LLLGQPNNLSLAESIELRPKTTDAHWTNKRNIEIKDDHFVKHDQLVQERLPKENIRPVRLTTCQIAMPSHRVFGHACDGPLRAPCWQRRDLDVDDGVEVHR